MNDLFGDWLSRSKSSDAVESQRKDQPNYWTSDLSSLLSTSSLHSFSLGTGDNIYESILPTILEAEHEVILVTCFWARSSTQERLYNTLQALSQKAQASNRKIRVRIYFSSVSIWQKLFHTPSLSGKNYPPSSWLKTFGLDPERLGRLDLQIKSIFVLPVSIIHPKFILVDRTRVFLPSCNVSWEDWFEGYVEMSGPIVEKFVDFWTNFWASEADRWLDWNPSMATNSSTTPPAQGGPCMLAHDTLRFNDVPTAFLPSPHHQNPRITLPWRPSPPPPPTPLNFFLLTIFAKAKRTIYIQTPNLTARPVIDALLSALQRGVNVRVVTSEKLMVLEQLVTAWTTTPRSIKAMIRRYQRVQAPLEQDLEAGTGGKLGRLRIAYYVPRPDSGLETNEPVQSHLKLTVVDEETVVLGSGNMDRPSWFTSQELDVAFCSGDFARRVGKSVDRALEGRTKLVHDSDS